jgi:hypothetical protein
VIPVIQENTEDNILDLNRDESDLTEEGFAPLNDDDAASTENNQVNHEYQEG